MALSAIDMLRISELKMAVETISKKEELEINEYMIVLGCIEILRSIGVK